MYYCKVCAMAINHKNYGVNEAGLPEKNEAEEILYCPFCGAGREYFTEDKKEIYSIGSGGLSPEDNILLDHAAKLEIFNGDFYEEAVKRSQSPEVKEMFAALSKIEYIHARIHLRLLGKKEKPELKKMSYERLKTDKDFIKEANEREKHAVAFYKKSMKNTENNIIKKVMEALMKIEGDHIDMTH